MAAVQPVGHNYIDTGSGNDTVIASGDYNTIITTSEFAVPTNDTDVVVNDGGYATIVTGVGDDTVYYSGGYNHILTGAGDDVVTEIKKGTDGDVHGSKVWGDPHYNLTGLDGKAINFDQQGIAGNTYNVFSGDGIEVDGLMGTYSNGSSYKVITKATVTAGDDSLVFDANNSATLNGQKIASGDTVTLDDGSTATVNGNVCTVTTSEGDASVNITNSGGYLDIAPVGDFSSLGGIIGFAIANNKALTEEECEKYNITVNGDNARNDANPFASIIKNLNIPAVNI